ncbi:MAG: DEAD/DEAH box helicase [Candidatus Brocadiae bacterium]|nr:DEAD/DEAH box helicase [Candidatus Brocadiia bacterium]
MPRCVIVQSDRSVLLEVDVPGFEEARDALARFAELEKSPEHVHTYRISPLSLWNAASSGLRADDVLAALAAHAKYEVPQNVRADVREQMARFGRLRLEAAPGGGFVLRGEDELLVEQVWRNIKIRPLLGPRLGAREIRIDGAQRGPVKQALLKIGWPVEDLAGYVDGDPLEVIVRESRKAGGTWGLREYQKQSADAFWAGGATRGGSGVVVLPCGAGKTMVGIAAMERVQARTLILCTNVVAARQWRDELLDKTSLTAEQVGEYTGQVKDVKPVTIATYQILTWRKKKTDPFLHFELFNRANWGLILYDEVHLLPAPVFRVTAEIQARRRLGLTATLVREDGREGDVFSLIGPKKYDVPWRVLEKQGWIATALCREVRVDLAPAERLRYASGGEREQFRIASENPAKTEVVRDLLGRHAGDRVLLIGQYLDQVESMAETFGTKAITGQTPVRERETVYGEFREGKRKLLVLSKVGNFSLDLPDANVLIQVSGTFGSRQEEAQRLGRVLRPKSDKSQASFYSLVTRATREEDFAHKRQLFLTEQGYRYEVMEAAAAGGVR